MRTFSRSILFFLFVLLFSSAFSMLNAQSNSGSISGTVTDPSGAVIPGASVSIQNPVSAYTQNDNDRQRRPFPFLESAVQSLPPDGHEGRLCGLRRRRGRRLYRSRHLEYPS